MAEARIVTFALRNGEQRVYKDVTRVDDSRRHLVLVYSNDVLTAQLNKHDVIKFTFAEPTPAAAEAAEAAPSS
jgi:hypothetical protein